MTAAEKIFYCVQSDDLDELKQLLLDQGHDEIKANLEQVINVIVWTKESNLRDGVTSLHYAAKRGRYRLLKEMIRCEGVGKYRLDIDVASSVLGWSSLHYAAYSGHVSIVKLLLRRLAKVDALSKNLQTPLHVSVRAGMKYVTALLVNHGASLNAQDHRGMTSLHYAVDRHTLDKHHGGVKHTREIVDFLLKKGADTSLSNNDGDTALHCAIQANVDAQVVKQLAQHMKKTNSVTKENRLGLSAMHLCHNVQTFQALLSAGVSVNQMCADGKTCLHRCSNDYEMVSLLMGKNADKTIKDKQGRLALHVAMTHTQPCFDSIKLLAGDHKLINATDKNGMTPLHLLCINKYTSIKMRDNTGVTKEQPIGSNNDPVLEYLVEGGADLDSQNLVGQTALHLALKHKQFPRATYLIAQGASLDIHDNSHMTPRQVNPGWTRKSLSMATDKIRARASTVASQSPHAERKLAKRKSPLPKWVTSSNIQTNFGNASEAERKKLSRELTQLQDDVKSVKNFLEEFSDEGNAKDYDSDACAGSPSGTAAVDGKKRPKSNTPDANKSVDSINDILKSLETK